MPSPDVAAYTDLPLIALDAQTLIDNALAELQTTFPDWSPREGNTELVLLEQLAAMVEDNVYALNQLPNGITEALLRLFGVLRDQGSPPSAQVTFTLNDTDGHTIPAGTTVRLNLGTGLDPVDLITSDDLVIAAGATTGTVTASGVTPTVIANGASAGTALELLDAITYVDSAVLAADASGGRVAEDGNTFLDRAVPYLATLTTTLVRPADITNYVAQGYPDVTRVQVLDLYDPTTPANQPGTQPGYVTIAVAGTGGSSLGAARDTIAADVRNRMHAGLKVAVVDADVTTVNVAVTVIRLATVDAATVHDNVTAALAALLSPDSWDWSSTVYVNDVIAKAGAATGVDVVTAVALPAGDVALPGYAPLAKAGTITVTVQEPS